MKWFALLWGMLFSVNVIGQQAGWLTYYEKSGNKATPRYDETIGYLKRMAAAYPMVNVSYFGKSGQGRDLPLVIIDKDGRSTPEGIRSSGRSVLLIQACIHPGECEGKDAGMMLIRDIVVEKKHPGILDHVSILFIPIFNVDGHERFGPFNRINQNGPDEMGWRVTADNHNLNRDYLKADTPEMQAWLKMFNSWMPDFFIDTHTTDGADYQYLLTYQMEILGEMDPDLTAWSRDVFLKEMTGYMEDHGIPVFPYIEFRNWFDIRSGLISSVAPPMLSQGYTSRMNRPGLLLETHMLKSYEQRVGATYQCLLVSLQILNREHTRLENLISSADRLTASGKFRAEPFPLQFETTSTDSVMVDFLGISYEKVISPVTGKSYYHYTGNKITEHLPWFDHAKPSVVCKLPEAYLIPPQWKEVISRLRYHGIKMKYLTHDTVLYVHSWRITNPVWQQNPYEGRHILTKFQSSDTTVERSFPAGSVIIDLAQPGARIIAELLEPEGDGSLLYWGFFDGIFEQKEYAEEYVMEPLAEQMLEKDPALRREFEEMKKKDSSFASNQFLMLNWFYSKTPYRDPARYMYPVGRIYDRRLVDKLTAGK